MSALMLESHGREVSVAEFRARVYEINIRTGLRYVTVMSGLLLRGRLTEWANRANSFNLPLLAKALVLWGREDGGREMLGEDVLWLLRAINSLTWHSRLAGEFDTDDAVLRMIIRQGFQRYYTDDPLDARIARTWMMFHDLVKEGSCPVCDPSAELQRLLGVSAEDLWAVGMMIWTYHVSVTALDGRKWVIDPTQFVLKGPRQDEVNALVSHVLGTIALTPQQFRDRYTAESSKYRDKQDREGHWLSEFNILRDYPVVHLGDQKLVAPFPPFALTRALDGFYYDLLDEFANRKRASGAGGNAYDNDMSTTLGNLFERYIGRQLQQLPVAGDQLRGEFEYGSKKSKKMSTDWILQRMSRLPVLFECKAREAVLDVQRYADLTELRTEIGKALGKACRQLVKFIQAVDARTPGLEQYFGQTNFIGAVVLLAPLPFHMVKDIRDVIESVAIEMEPDWAKVRSRIHFVPMSARELETAVATEITLGVPIEDQLTEYATYREQVKRIDRWENGMPVFPRHLEEFLQERWGQSRRMVNPLCHAAWSTFGEFCQRRIFDEAIDVADRELFEIIQRKAYELWQLRGSPLWDDQRDWFEAEQIISDDPNMIAAG